MYKLIWRTFCLLWLKKILQDFLSSNEQKVTRNEHRAKSFTSFQTNSSSLTKLSSSNSHHSPKFTTSSFLSPETIISCPSDFKFPGTFQHVLGASLVHTFSFFRTVSCSRFLQFVLIFLWLFLKSLPLYFLCKNIINFTKFFALMKTYESYWKLLNMFLWFFYRL